MPGLGSLSRGLNGPRLCYKQGAVTGTAALGTGAQALIAGTAHASVANAPATSPTQTVEITSISGGSITVIVVDLASTPTITIPSVVARNVNVTAWGA